MNGNNQGSSVVFFLISFVVIVFLVPMDGIYVFQVSDLVVVACYGLIDDGRILSPATMASMLSPEKARFNGLDFSGKVVLLGFGAMDFPCYGFPRPVQSS